MIEHHSELMSHVSWDYVIVQTVGYGDLAVSSQKARFFSIIYITLSVIVL